MDVRRNLLAASPETPGHVIEALERLATELSAAAGANLAALVLYGGVARGSYRPGRSDVNVAVVLESAAPEHLEALAPALQAAWRAARVEPWLVTRGELPRLAALFPSKILDVAGCHVVLLGADSFRDLVASGELVRFRAEQALRNLALRLRRRLVATTGDPDAQARWAAEIARPLAAELAPLVTGVHPGRDATSDVLAAASAAFGLDRATLAELAEARTSPRRVSDPGALLRRAVAVVDAAAAAVGTRRGPP
jgi:hypothetical protein